MTHENSKLVYSTDRSIPEKKKIDSISEGSTIKPEQQNIIVRMERKGRRGKSVTVVECLEMNQSDKSIFLKQLKTKLGTGGTIKDNRFEFQGDHCSRLMVELKNMGYKPRRSGG